MPVYGLYYYREYELVSLPLLGVRAEASIKELAAQVKLTQTYGNDATFPIEAMYSFPIPARAAVCAFVMVKQDGTRVVGSVLEKQEARETYNTAVAQGQQASLMEQQTPDVFQVSVGNIPPNEQVQIELVYATELSEDEENDSIRFHLPIHIGARYGQGPQSTPTPSAFRGTVFISSSSPTPFLTLAMSVEAIAPISKIGCPSHSVSTELGPDPKLPNFKELPFSNYARVSLSSDSPLDKDFVLTIKSAGLDTPRCVAELHPTHDTVALGLTLVPRFKLPDISRQEFVFLVDCSGSMDGKRIEAARKALVVMLRALPHQESLFQIISFGSHSTALWAQGSKPYNQKTLEEATRHVDGMRADYGGTEITVALQHCFQARKLDRPTSVLVLTDGEAWDLDRVLGEVQTAVAKAPKEAYLRVSVLGIGDSVSMAMCEGIARVGNGTCMLVGEEEATFTGKIARMLKAAKTPPISNISIDWGRQDSKANVASPRVFEDFELVEVTSGKGKEKTQKTTLNIFDDSVDDHTQVDSTPVPPPPPVVLAAFPAVQQAPFIIRNLYPHIRLNVYGILQGKTIPQTVTIRGTSASGDEIAFPIPVTLSHLQDTPIAPPVVHALAARKLIQDLEDGQHALKMDDMDLLARTVQSSVVRLGTTYSIASTHTSFVAVDEAKLNAPPAKVVYSVPAAASASPPGNSNTRYRSTRGFVASQSPSVVKNKAYNDTFNDASHFFVNKSLPQYDRAVSHKPQPPGASGYIPPSMRGAYVPPAIRYKRESHFLAESVAAPKVDLVEALARLQSFNGCFALDVLTVVALKANTDIEAVRAVLPAGATDGVVASVLAMAFLATKLSAEVERESWEGIYEKARQYVEAALQKMGAAETAEALQAKIVSLLA